MDETSSSGRKMNVLSLFTGIGGLDLGLERAGFLVELCAERDEDSRKSVQISRPNWKLSESRDLLEDPIDDVLAALSGSTTLISAGPPCQPFSKSSQWQPMRRGGVEDPRAATLGAVLDYVYALRPDAVLIENVPGIARSSKDRGSGRAFMDEAFAEINRRTSSSYAPVHLLLNARDYGVPQRRIRHFTVAFREGQDFPKLPALTGPTCTEPWRTVWDALNGIPQPGPEELTDLHATGRWADLLPSIPEGWNYQWHTARGGGHPLFGFRTKFWSFLLKLAKGLPSWTLQASPGPATGPFHWANRRLSVAEMLAIQTFPSNMVAVGSYRSQLRQLGNAVPSALAEHLGRAIRARLEGTTIDEGLPSLCPKTADETPGPSVPAAIPAKYHNMVGDHPAHPGPGRGPAYRVAATR